MAADYFPAERLRMIFELVSERGLVSVTELRERLGVAGVTIRRDLALLEGKGVLERTHGGAISTRRLMTEPLYTKKNQSEQDEKVAIGRAAAALAQEGDTLFINSGSTTLQVIRHLSAPNVRVITSNVGATLLPEESQVETVLTGGVFRSQSNSLVGRFATLSLEQAYGSRAFIGVDGISFKYGLTTPVHQESEIAALMIARTRGPVVVVADHTKIGVVSNFVSARIEDVDVLVTDSGFEEEYRADLEMAGVKIIVAPGARRETVNEGIKE